MTKQEEIEQYFEQSKVERKQEFIDTVLNPIPEGDFSVEDFDPLKDNTEDYYLLQRERKNLPEFLPTMGMLPKEILEWQMVGMYESKQDLYLIFANKINELTARIKALESNK